MNKLENKMVFIKERLSGIGKACAFAAIKEGANAAVADLKSGRNDENGKVTSSNQAISIGVKEAKEAGLKVPAKKAVK